MPFDIPPAIVLLQQAPAQPQIDLAVEVVGNLPLQTKLADVSRRLARRRAANTRRLYPSTILELITLVERNPIKPTGKTWDSIGSLSMRYNQQAGTLTVEYCVDHCAFDPTGKFDPKRKTVSYSAAEKDVVKKADKKLKHLQKYADR